MTGRNIFVISGEPAPRSEANYAAMAFPAMVVAAQGRGGARLQRSTGRIVVRSADGTLREAAGGRALGVKLPPEVRDWDLMAATDTVAAATPRGIELHDGERVRLVVRSGRVEGVWADRYLPYLWVLTRDSPLLQITRFGTLRHLSCFDLEGRRIGPKDWVVAPFGEPLGFLRPEDVAQLALLSDGEKRGRSGSGTDAASSGLGSRRDQ